MCIHVCSGEAKKISLGGQFKSNKIIKGRIRILLVFERAMGRGNGPDEVFYHTKFIIFGYLYQFRLIGFDFYWISYKICSANSKILIFKGASDKFLFNL